MKIREAIAHAKAVAEEQEKKGCRSCSDEHRQLAAWLEELMDFRRSLSLEAKVVKVYPYRTAQVRGVIDLPLSEDFVEDLVRRAGEVLGHQIRGRNHIVVALEGGMYMWLSDRHVYIGSQLIERSW